MVVVVVVVKVRMYVRLAQPYLVLSQCDTREKNNEKSDTKRSLKCKKKNEDKLITI